MDSFSAADLPDDEDMVSARCSGTVCGRRVDFSEFVGIIPGLYSSRQCSKGSCFLPSRKVRLGGLGGRGRIMRRRKTSNSRQDDSASSN